MTGIGGPGGIGGPKGPSGIDGPEGVDELAGPEGLDGPDAADGLERASGVAAGQLDALAADIAAGKLTTREAIDRMVDQAGADLGQTEKAELRELIVDLVENDPYLSALVGRV